MWRRMLLGVVVIRGLMERHGVTPLVYHDRRQLEASAIPAWSR